jgi:hypothetical protein
MFKASLNLFILREMEWSDFNFPRFQAWAVTVAIGLLVGLDPAMRIDMLMPLWTAILFGVLMLVTSLPLIVIFLKWWMKRGGRWDGNGNLFNLIVSSWLVTDIFGAGLIALGVPMLFTLPVWLYSLWVGGHALSSVIPKASLSYSISGILLSIIPTTLIIMVVGTVFFGALGSAGVMPAQLVTN